MQPLIDLIEIYIFIFRLAFETDFTGFVSDVDTWVTEMEMECHLCAMCTVLWIECESSKILKSEQKMHLPE